MNVVDMEQGSSEWLAYRCGRVTASRIADLMAKTKTGWGASRANYAAELVAERLTGSPAEKFSNAAMQWGTEKEPEARDTYALVTGATVKQIGIVQHPTIEMAAASPDGLVGNDGLVEIKCPNTATHISTLLAEAIDKKYVLQMQWQMACTGRAWCDFVSYDPRMPAEMSLFIQRVPRDDTMIAELTREVEIFLAEVTDTVAKLEAKFGMAEAAE